MAVEHQEDSQILLEQIMPQIAAQLRGAMGNIHTALTRLVPEEMPEGPPGRAPPSCARATTGCCGW